jgi:hypothetical protein
MEKVHCMSLSFIHILIHNNHDPVQAQLCTQRVWERVVNTFCTEVVGAWLYGIYFCAARRLYVYLWCWNPMETPHTARQLIAHRLQGIQ